MGDDDIGQIKDRLTRLEVQVVERWSSHDKRSDERWADLMEQFHELGAKVENRPCSDHVKLLLEQNARIKNLEAWVDKAGWAISIIYVAFVGALIKHWLKI